MVNLSIYINIYQSVIQVISYCTEVRSFLWTIKRHIYSSYNPSLPNLNILATITNNWKTSILKHLFIYIKKT